MKTSPVMMLTNFLKWITGPEQFWPGQRVALLSDYPCDMADTARQCPCYGTVQERNERSAKAGEVRVLWDGFEGIRHHMPDTLGSRIMLVGTTIPAAVVEDALRTLLEYDEPSRRQEAIEQRRASMTNNEIIKEVAASLSILL